MHTIDASAWLVLITDLSLNVVVMNSGEETAMQWEGEIERDNAFRSVPSSGPSCAPPNASSALVPVAALSQLRTPDTTQACNFKRLLRSTCPHRASGTSSCPCRPYLRVDLPPRSDLSVVGGECHHSLLTLIRSNTQAERKRRRGVRTRKQQFRRFM